MTLIPNETELLRRVFDGENFLVWDADQHRWRPSRAAVKFDGDGMSVFDRPRLEARSRSDADVATLGDTRDPGQVFSLTAGEVRGLECDAVDSADDATPIGFAHCSITPPEGATGKMRGLRNDLSRLMTWTYGALPTPPSGA